MIARHRALAILDECTGDEIWSLEHCRARGVPPAWIEELADTFESGFRSDRETIYVGDLATNQYRGIRDVDLARKAAESLGLSVERATEFASSRRAIVLALKTALMEGD